MPVTVVLSFLGLLFHILVLGVRRCDLKQTRAARFQSKALGPARSLGCQEERESEWMWTGDPNSSVFWISEVTMEAKGSESKCPGKPLEDSEEGSGTTRLVLYISFWSLCGC